MGSRDSQKQLWSYEVNLDKRVRSDHPLRKVNEVLKFDCVREEVAKFYGMKGNVSEDPAVIMKMSFTGRWRCRHFRFRTNGTSEMINEPRVPGCCAPKGVKKGWSCLSAVAYWRPAR